MTNYLLCSDVLCIIKERSKQSYSIKMMDFIAIFFMIYITGDIHGNVFYIDNFFEDKNISKDDILIMLGDVGINYFNDNCDKSRKRILNNIGMTIFCIHGNHEMRPASIPSYRLINYKGGKVWVEEEFPNILFAKDGEVFDFEINSEQVKVLIIGGAYSVDKDYRLKMGYKWFSDEQPNDEIKQYIEKKIRNNNKFDIVLTHTAPIKYEPREWFIEGIDDNNVDKSTEQWLDKIEDSIEYKKWYCGHYHGEKVVNKLEFLFNTIKIVEI